MNQRKSTATYVATLAVLLACMVLGGVAATGDTPLTAPTGLTAADGTTFGQANLAWNAVPGATHYRVGWIPESDVDRTPGADWLNNFNFVDRAGPATNYTVENLAQGEKYWFIVGALQERFGNTGDAWSDWTNVTTAQDTGGSSPTDCIAAGTCLLIRNVGQQSGTGDSTEYAFDLQPGLYRLTLVAESLVSADLVSTMPGRDIYYFDYTTSTDTTAQELKTVDADDAGVYLLAIDANDDAEWTFTIDRIGN